MGIGDWIDKVGDAVENAVDEVETKAGSVIDRGAHTVADFAREHGAGGVADAIDEIGDQISNALGGEIVEKELGQTKDKTELIHGEPSAIHDVVGKLKSMSSSIESTGDALRKIDVADWTGKAATAFHTEFDKQPKAWFTAGDAFTKAAAHLDNWYWALETAQAKAQDAIEKWEAADKEEKSKKSAWNALSDKEKKATPLVDTWTSMRDEARSILKNARSQRDNIASQVVSGLQAETQEAPTEPPLSQRLSADFDDLKGVYDYGKLSFGTGLLTSFSSIVQFARSTNITDPYNMSHPAEYFSSMADLGTGIVTAAADPGAVVDAMLSDARKNPFETGGAITGNIILTIATGGGGSAKVAAETVEEATNAVRLTETAANLVKDAPGAVPKGVPRVEAPSLPGRGTPAVERPVEPSGGSGNPAATRPNAVQPEAAAPQSPGAGVPKPDANAPGPAGVPESGPAAGPHPDGAAPQPHPSDAPLSTTEPGTPPSHPDTPMHPEGAAAQPNPSAEPRPVEVTHDPSSAGPHADRPGQPGLAADQPGQPGLATDRAPGDGAAPHQQPENLRSEPEPGRPHPDSDAGGPRADKPGDAEPTHEQVRPSPHPDAETPASPHNEPNSPAPHSDTPEAPHSPEADDRQPAAEHNPAHNGDPNGTQTGGHDSPPDHAAPSHEDQPGSHSTLEDHAGDDRQVPDHARTGNPEDTSDFAHKTCTDDPVDIATGTFLLPQTDIELPGVLGLVLRRTHRSNYRFGRWFGPSWSATLDMRLVVDRDGVAFLGEDTVMLAFRHADVGDEVEPVAGTRGWRLTRTELGGYQLRDPKRDLIFHFAPEPGMLGLDARLGNFAISAITDRHHNRVRFHYDGDGIPTAVTHSGGYRVDIGTADGRITALTVVTEGEERESRTPVREFGYESGNLVAVTNAVGATTRFAYDDSAQMLSWTDFNDNSMVNTYDEAGRVVRQRGSGGVLNCDLEYLDFPDGSGHLTTMTDSVGGVSTHGFDNDLRLRDIIDPVGGHTHTDYNTARKPLKIVAPDGAATSYAYTDTGEVAQITRPDGATIAVDYLLGNRPTIVTDADGSVRRQEWNDNGDLTAVIDAGGLRKEFAYHSNGAVAAVVAATGARTVVEVDPAGLPVAVTDPYGAVTRIDRDGFGRPITVTDPLGAITRYEWSAQGKPLCRIDPDGHNESWVWDGEGNLLAHTNGAGGITTFTYGAFDLLESRTDPDGSTTRYTWDTERRLTTVTNSLGQTWVYEYDLAGRLIAETDFNGATTRYTHDPAGRVATITPATGVTRRHRRDILGRTTEISADTGEWLRYRHDPLGRVLTAISGDGEYPIHTLEFAYDPSGRLSAQQLDDQPAMRHAYDEYGRRIHRTLPGGATTTWQWNLADRVSAVNADGHHIGFDYDALGRQTGWRIAELAVTRVRSEVGSLTSQSVTAFPGSSLNLESSSLARPAPQVIRHDSFTYRPDGYPIDHTLARLDKTTEARHYALDPIGRVTAITENGDATEAYTYDPLGNIIGDAAVRENPQPGAGREYRGNLLIRDGRTRYSYDAAGRLIRKTTTRISRKPSVWTYRYNAFDQLIAVQTPDHRWWHYTYDAAGRRTSKICRADDGTIIDHVDYTWDDTHLVEQTTGDSSLRWQYRPDSYAPIAQTDDQDTIDRAFYAIVTDLVGTPTDLINPDTGEIVATATTDLWGQTSWRGGTSTPLRFPGQIHDAETGLHYNLHRVYDPATGRYLTLDPLGLAPAPNPSLYPHNPTVWIDPLGLTPCEDYENLIEKLDDNTYFHYTNEETYHLIMSENGARFVANDVGKLFFTQEMLTPAEVEMNIFIGNPLYIGKGDFVIAFTKPEGAFFRHGEQPNEFIHQGGLKIPSGDVLYHGRNPFS
ncbi:putative T7SS-secreted protein [Nocardia niigatensis]